jgi:hypothetical protein
MDVDYIGNVKGMDQWNWKKGRESTVWANRKQGTVKVL